MNKRSLLMAMVFGLLWAQGVLGSDSGPSDIVFKKLNDVGLAGPWFRSKGTVPYYMIPVSIGEVEQANSACYAIKNGVALMKLALGQPVDLKKELTDTTFTQQFIAQCSAKNASRNVAGIVKTLQNPLGYKVSPTGSLTIIDDLDAQQDSVVAIAKENRFPSVFIVRAGTMDNSTWFTVLVVKNNEGGRNYYFAMGGAVNHSYFNNLVNIIEQASAPIKVAAPSTPEKLQEQAKKEQLAMQKIGQEATVEAPKRIEQAKNQIKAALNVGLPLDPRTVPQGQRNGFAKETQQLFEKVLNSTSPLDEASENAAFTDLGNLLRHIPENYYIGNFYSKASDKKQLEQLFKNFIQKWRNVDLVDDGFAAVLTKVVSFLENPWVAPASEQPTPQLQSKKPPIATATKPPVTPSAAQQDKTFNDKQANQQDCIKRMQQKITDAQKQPDFPNKQLFINNVQAAINKLGQFNTKLNPAAQKEILGLIDAALLLISDHILLNSDKLSFKQSFAQLVATWDAPEKCANVPSDLGSLLEKSSNIATSQSQPQSSQATTPTAAQQADTKALELKGCIAGLNGVIDTASQFSIQNELSPEMIAAKNEFATHLKTYVKVLGKGRSDILSNSVRNFLPLPLKGKINPNDLPVFFKNVNEQRLSFPNDCKNLKEKIQEYFSLQWTPLSETPPAKPAKPTTPIPVKKQPEAQQQATKVPTPSTTPPVKSETQPQVTLSAKQQKCIQELGYGLNGQMQNYDRLTTDAKTAFVQGFYPIVNELNNLVDMEVNAAAYRATSQKILGMIQTQLAQVPGTTYNLEQAKQQLTDYFDKRLMRQWGTEYLNCNSHELIGYLSTVLDNWAEQKAEPTPAQQKQSQKPPTGQTQSAPSREDEIAYLQQKSTSVKITQNQIQCLGSIVEMLNQNHDILSQEPQVNNDKIQFINKIKLILSELETSSTKWSLKKGWGAEFIRKIYGDLDSACAVLAGSPNEEGLAAFKRLMMGAMFYMETPESCQFIMQSLDTLLGHPILQLMQKIGIVIDQLKDQMQQQGYIDKGVLNKLTDDYNRLVRVTGSDNPFAAVYAKITKYPTTQPQPTKTPAGQQQSSSTQGPTQAPGPLSAKQQEYLKEINQAIDEGLTSGLQNANAAEAAAKNEFARQIKLVLGNIGSVNTDIVDSMLEKNLQDIVTALNPLPAGLVPVEPGKPDYKTSMKSLFRSLMVSWSNPEQMTMRTIKGKLKSWLEESW